MFAFVYVYTGTGHHIFQITTGQLAIIFEFFYAIENVTIDNISIAIINQSLDGFNDIINMLGYTRINMCTTNIQLIHYFKIGINVTVADIKPLHAFFISSIDNFIINVGKVLYMGYIVAFML